MTRIINTYNESNLHNTLKTLYAANYNGKTEINTDGFIYDVITQNNEIIEIQTANLAKLLPKILSTLEKNKKITVVHPIINTKTIITYDESGKQLSKRKSPKKENIYNLFKELTGIYPVLLSENFTLEVIEISMTEERIKYTEPIQSQNNRRRFKKNWKKINKKLNEILLIRKFKTKEDYLNLLPSDLPNYFCAKDLQTAFKKNNTYPSSATKQAHLILWVYSRMEIIEFIEIKNRSRFYKISN